MATMTTMTTMTAMATMAVVAVFWVTVISRAPVAASAGAGDGLENIAGTSHHPAGGMGISTG